MNNFYGYIDGNIYENKDFAISNFISISNGKKENIVIKGFYNNSIIFNRLYDIECKDSDKKGTYEVTSFSISHPTNFESKRYYLSTFYGVGESYSIKIMEHFGDNVLEILDKNPSEIKKVKGISRVAKNNIEENWCNSRFKDGVIRDLFSMLTNEKIPFKRANAIISKINKMEINFFKNPYELLIFEEINFKIADIIALNVGIPVDSPERLKRGINYYCNELIYKKNGDCCIEREELEDFCFYNLLNDMDKIKESIKDNIDINIYEIEINNKKYIMPSQYYWAERNVSEKIKEILDKESLLFNKRNIERELEYINNGDKQYNEEQINAISNIFKHKISLIIGGPGTGKTTIVDKMISMSSHVSEKNNIEIKLIAPTGKAAKRMKESTGLEASTIHRAILDCEKEHICLKGDIIVIDEGSMIDILLMENLMKFISENSHVVIIGDTDQLPSISPGQVLKDLMISNVIPKVKLEHVYRFKNNLIKINANHIKNGEEIELPEEDNKDSDFYFMEYDVNSYKNKYENFNSMLSDIVVKLYTRYIPDKKGFDPIEDIQVLVPMNVGQIGAIEINKRIQNEINPCVNKNKELVFGDTCYRIGDKIIQRKNNYLMKIFNGDIGIIKDVDKKKYKLIVDFDGSLHTLGFDHFEHISLAYALTIHKSQGSEYKAIIMPFSKSQINMLERKLIFTALTRAKKLAIFTGDKFCLDYGIKNNKNSDRKTGLSKKLIEEFN